MVVPYISLDKIHIDFIMNVFSIQISGGSKVNPKINPIKFLFSDTFID